MTAKPRVYITRQLPFRALDRLHEQCDLRVWPGDLPPSPEVLLDELVDCEGLLSLLTDKIDADVMSVASNLRVISNFAVGYDNIDIPAATGRGIPVGNTPGILTETSADLTFALLLAAARRLSESERAIQAGFWQTWSPTMMLGQDVHGATLGIIGLGRIGQAVARRARGFNMQIIYHGGSDDAVAKEIGARRVSFDAVLQQSDFISLHVPLTHDTYHLIGEHELKLMKKSAILINTARGGIVDPEALYYALKNGDIWAAALDVTEPEPIHADDPLLELDNCLIVPHIGSSSVATREKMAMLAVNNLIAGLRGERLPNCVNPEVYDNGSITR